MQGFTMGIDPIHANKEKKKRCYSWLLITGDLKKEFSCFKSRCYSNLRELIYGIHRIIVI